MCIVMYCTLLSGNDTVSLLYRNCNTVHNMSQDDFFLRNRVALAQIVLNMG